MIAGSTEFFNFAEPFVKKSSVNQLIMKWDLKILADLNDHKYLGGHKMNKLPKRLCIVLLLAAAYVYFCLKHLLCFIGKRDKFRKSLGEERYSWSGGVESLTDKVQVNFQNKITREEFSELAVKLYESLSGKEAEAPTNHPFTDTRNEKLRPRTSSE